MKKIFLSLLAIATITISAEAQTKRIVPDKTDNNPKENTLQKHGKRPHHMLAKTLNFSAAQKQQLKSINEEYKSQVTNLDKTNSNLSAEELKSKKEDLMRQRRQKTMALLTPEQKIKMENLKKENKGDGEMGKAKRMEKMQTKLGLSDEQMQKMKEQRETFTSKREGIKNDQSLSMEQKKEQLKSLQDEKMNNFKSFLTPDQLKKMEDMKHKKTMKAA